MTAQPLTGRFEVARKPRGASRSKQFTIITDPNKWGAKAVEALIGMEPGHKTKYPEDGDTVWRVRVQAV